MMNNSQMEEDNVHVLQADLYELTKDYGQYLHVDASKERQAFYNSIEEMLTKLDEFGGLVDTIRSDTSLCVDKNVQEIQAKCADMKQIFSRIDQLEEFVQIVREDVTCMEECVNKAENEMGSFSSFRKMFSSLVGGKKSSQNKEERTEFVSPDIFVTEQYLHPASNTQQTDPVIPEGDRIQDIPNPEMPEVDKSKDVPNPEMPEVDKSKDIPNPEMPEVDKSKDIPNPEMPEVDKSKDIPNPEMPEVDKSKGDPNVKPSADT